MKHFMIIILATLSFTACSQAPAGQKNVIEQADAEKFRQLIESSQGTILDVRTAEEVADGRIANSIHYDIFEDSFETNIEKLDKNREVFVYCAGGGRSNEAAELLQKKGFKKIYNLKDGFDDWQEKGFPVVRD